MTYLRNAYLLTFLARSSADGDGDSLPFGFTYSSSGVGCRLVRFGKGCVLMATLVLAARIRLNARIKCFMLNSVIIKMYPIVSSNSGLSKPASV